jgi:hypothetical protein
MGALGVTHGKPLSAYLCNRDYQPEHPMPLGLISWMVSPSIEHCKSVITPLSIQKNKSLKAARKHRQTICRDVLQIYSAHPTFNAYQDVDFGANIHGITKATVSDILHVIKEGIVPRILEVLFSLLPASTKVNISKYINSLFSRKGRNISGEKGSFPTLHSPMDIHPLLSSPQMKGLEGLDSYLFYPFSCTPPMVGAST